MKTIFILPALLMIIQNAFAQVTALEDNYSEKIQLSSNITGESIVCDFIMNGAIKYDVDAIAGVNAYFWQCPEGVSVVEGQGTNSVFIQFDNNFTGGELVLHVSGSGISGKIIKNINLLPQTPIFQKNVNSIKPNQTAVFSVEDNGETFTWEAPQGAEIIAGQGSSEAKIKFGKNYEGGFVSVSANNNCGLSLMTQTFVINSTKESGENDKSPSILAQKEY